MKKNKNMKGFVFTLDAIFALVIATVGISILLYANFTSSTSSYETPVSQAYSLLQSMTQTTIQVASGSSIYANYLASTFNSSASVWPQFGHDQALSSSTGSALPAPYLSLTVTANAPGNSLSTVVVDSQRAAFSLGNRIYILNLTSKKFKQDYPEGSGNPANIVGIPALYNNYLFWANASNSVISEGLSSNVPSWTFSSSNSVTTPIEIENNYVLFGTANALYVLNILNGSQIAYANIQQRVGPISYVDGEYLFSSVSKSSQNYLYSYALTTNSFTNNWKFPLTESVSTQPVSINNTIAVGSGNSLYILTLGGNQIFYSGSLGSNVLGISGYQSSYYVETSQNLYQFTTAGNIIGSTRTVTDLQNSTPSLSGSTLYTLINGDLFQGYSSNLGRLLWNISLPSNYLNTGYSQISLGGGDIFAANGNTLYVFGLYGPQNSDSILQSLSFMYLNGLGDYADSLFSSLYNSNSTGLFINDSYAPTLSVASFNSVSQSYIEQANGFGWINNAVEPFSISIWVYPTSTNGVIVDELGQKTPNLGWHDSYIDLVNGNVLISANGLSCLNLGTIPLNSLTNVVATFNGSVYTGYINGALANTETGSRGVPGGSSLLYYPLGVGDSKNCGSGAYFSGKLLDYQFYNTSMGTRQIMEGYQGGPFAAPYNGTRNVLWLPLGGNSNEFSGAFNIGVPYKITYNSIKYLPPSLSNAYQISKASLPYYINVNGTTSEYNLSVVVWR